MKRVSDLLTGALIAAALMCGVVGGMWGYQKWKHPTPTTRGERIPTKLDLSKPTVALITSAKCHFCQESQEFYKRLAATGVQIVLMTPDEPHPSFRVNEVTLVKSEAELPKGYRWTPTLMLLDSTGRVDKEYVGKLPEKTELEILSKVRTHESQN